MIPQLVSYLVQEINLIVINVNLPLLKLEINVYLAIFLVKLVPLIKILVILVKMDSIWTEIAVFLVPIPLLNVVMKILLLSVK